MPLPDDPFAPLLDELDRLEDLLEEMRDLGVTSIEDVQRRIDELNQRVDELAQE
jgi:hypothetical protein